MLFVEKCEQDTSYSTIFAPYEIMKKFWLLQGLAIPKHSYGIHIVELRFFDSIYKKLARAGFEPTVLSLS